MFISNECLWTIRSQSLFLNVNKVIRSKYSPCRFFFKRSSSDQKDSKTKNLEMKPLTGFDDVNFSDNFMKSLRDFNIVKTGFYNLMSECRRFYKEECNFKDRGNIEIENPLTSVRILYKFEKPEDLKNCVVKTDSTYNLGYSSASLKLSSNETAIFSGNICTDVPKSGDVRIAGYTNVQFPKQRRAFFRNKPYDWTEYTHLVFKIRGDGRTYLVLLNLPFVYAEIGYSQYGLQLFTRGGPYWQIVKLPFSHFFLIRKGKINDLQGKHVPLDDIVNISITVGAYDGPFKLEIDYIGLECKKYHKSTSPYELYRM